MISQSHGKRRRGERDEHLPQTGPQGPQTSAAFALLFHDLAVTLKEDHSCHRAAQRYANNPSFVFQLLNT